MQTNVQPQPALRINHGLTAWVVCLTAALFFFYEFIQGFVFNTIAADVMREFGLNAEQLGWLTGVYFIANMLFLIPAGLLLDRYSTRAIILVSLAVCIFGTFLLSISHHYEIALICRFLTGIGSAFCFLACIRLASRWFDASKMAFVTGAIVTVAMAGGVVAQAPMSLLSASVGWRQAVFYDGLLGFVVMFLIWKFVRDTPEGASQDTMQKAHNLSIWACMGRAYFNKQNLYPAIYTSLINAPLMVFGGMAGGLFLRQAQGFDAATAAYITSMIFFGTIVGGPLVGKISDTLGMRRVPMLIGAVLSFNVMWLILQLNQLPMLGWAMLFFLLGLVTSTQVLSYPAVASRNPPVLTATAVSIISILTQGGGAFYQPLFGRVLAAGWDGRMVDGVPFYALESYQTAMMLLGGGIILAFLAALLMKEKPE